MNIYSVVIIVWIAAFCANITTVLSGCTTNVDLVFMIDGSEEVMSNDYNKQLESVSRLLRKIDTSDYVRAGMVLYGYLPSAPIVLGSNLTEIIDSKTLKTPGGRPRADIGLVNARGIFRVHGRTGVLKKLILVTKNLNNFGHQALHQVKLAKHEGIQFHILSVGRYPEHNKNLLIDDVHMFNDNDHLVDSMENMVTTICSGLSRTNMHDNIYTPSLKPYRKNNTQSEEFADMFSKMVCVNATYFNSIGYSTNTFDCANFFECSKSDEKITAKRRTCSYGEKWDQTGFTCRKEALVHCPHDNCRIPILASSPKTQNCRTFYRCTGGQSVSSCCPEGSAYYPGKGCTRDVACIARCPPDSVPSDGTIGPCHNSAIFGRREIYKTYIKNGGYWLEMPCPEGSFFVEDACACVSGRDPQSAITNGKVLPACMAEIYLPFCDGLADHSGNENTVVNDGERIMVRNGKAYFNGYSKLILPRFASIDYGQTIVIKFKYKISKRKDLQHDIGDYDYSDEAYDSVNYDDGDPDHASDIMSLLSNDNCNGDVFDPGPCHDIPSIAITTNYGSTYFQLVNSENNNTVLDVNKNDKSVDYDKNRDGFNDDEFYYSQFVDEDYKTDCNNDNWDDGWRNITFMLDGGMFMVFDDNSSSFQTITGSILSTQSGLQFGQGSGIGGFQGYMDEIYVYFCRPDDDILFDGNIQNNKWKTTTPTSNVLKATPDWTRHDSASKDSPSSKTFNSKTTTPYSTKHLRPDSSLKEQQVTPKKLSGLTATERFHKHLSLNSTKGHSTKSFNLHMVNYTNGNLIKNNVTLSTKTNMSHANGKYRQETNDTSTYAENIKSTSDNDGKVTEQAESITRVLQGVTEPIYYQQRRKGLILHSIKKDTDVFYSKNIETKTSSLFDIKDITISHDIRNDNTQSFENYITQAGLHRTTDSIVQDKTTVPSTDIHSSKSIKNIHAQHAIEHDEQKHTEKPEQR